MKDLQTPPRPSQIEGGGSAARKPLTQRSSHETADDYTGGNRSPAEQPSRFNLQKRSPISDPTKRWK